MPGYTQKGDVTYFRVRDRDGTPSVPVTYAGRLPDPFRADREIVVDVVKKGDVLRRPDGLAGDEVPVEVHGRQDPDLTCSSRAKPA